MGNERMLAAFDRKDGRFLFHRNFNWRGIGLFGSTYTVPAGDLLFNGTEQIAAVWEDSGRLAKRSCACSAGLYARRPWSGRWRVPRRG